jgi:hypothetical protein
MRPVPQPVFRVIGVAILLAAIALPAYWAATDAGPYPWLVDAMPFDDGSDVVLGFLLLLAGCLVLGVIPILALRQLTAGMPTLADEAATLRRMADGDFSQADALARSPAFVRAMGLALLVAGTAVSGVAWVLLVDTGWLYPTLVAVGAVLAVMGLVAAVSGRMPRRRERGRAQRLRPYRQGRG